MRTLCGTCLEADTAGLNIPDGGGIVPYVGLGVMFNPQNGGSPFAVSYGVQGRLRVCGRLSVVMESGNGDNHGNNYSGLNSLKARLKNRHWDGKSPLAGEGSQKESILADAGVNDGGGVTGDADGMGVGSLSGSDNNIGEAADSRAHGVADDSVVESEAELAVAMDCRADDTAVALAGGFGTDGLETAADHDRKMNVDSSGESGDRGDSDSLYSASDYLAFVRSGNECVGSPIYFFFELGTAELTDRSQLVNLDELARIAKKYGLYITVVGAADAGTGTSNVNNALSVSRADYIVTELCMRGVDSGRIFKAGKGGISDYTPDEANRHTKVMLFIRR